MHWFFGFLERRLQRANVRFVAVAVLIVSMLLLSLTVATAVSGRTIFGPSLGADYAAFYTAGTILNEFPAERLYDLELQNRLYHSLFPQVPANQILPYANPPFLAAGFRLVALLPYAWSFLLWLALSASLYVGGLLLLCMCVRRMPPPDKRLALLLALSFEPFIMECWLGGQLSALGFFCIVLALRLDQRGRSFLSGAALAGCLYKPTLLPLLLAMMVFSRRWRTAVGFAVGGFCLAVVSLVVAGPHGCEDYTKLMLSYAGAATGTESVFRVWKFVDLNSFFKMASGGSAPVARVLACACGLIASPWLLRAWWAMDAGRAERRGLVWTGTAAATVVLNVYVGIYDSILVVPALLVVYDAVYQDEKLDRVFRLFLVLVYVTPWFSQALARAVGLQVYTLVLLAAAAWPFWIGRRSVAVAAPRGKGACLPGDTQPAVARGACPSASAGALSHSAG